MCNKSLQCISDGVTAAKRHQRTKEHEKAARSVKMSNTVSNMFKKSTNSQTRAHQVEIQTALFIAENNLPIALSNKMIDFLKTVDLDDEVRSKMKCNRTKCSAIIKNVVGRHGLKSLVEILKNKKFSLIIDESTDIGVLKHLVICVRYATEEGIRDDFLSLLKVNF